MNAMNRVRGRVLAPCAALLALGACSGASDSPGGERNAGPTTAHGAAHMTSSSPSGSAGAFGNSTTPTSTQVMKPVHTATSGSVDAGSGEEPMRACQVEPGGETFKLPVCKLKAAPDSFEPKLQWSVELGNGFGPPLVANLTDDNGDGVGRPVRHAGRDRDRGLRSARLAERPLASEPRSHLRARRRDRRTWSSSPRPP